MIALSVLLGRIDACYVEWEYQVASRRATEAQKQIAARVTRGDQNSIDIRVFGE